jgi:hypothetical protein
MLPNIVRPYSGKRQRYSKDSFGKSGRFFHGDQCVDLRFVINASPDFAMVLFCGLFVRLEPRVDC